MILRGYTFDDEQHVMFLLQCTLVYIKVAQPFGAGPLEEFQVVGVIDDTAGVGVFVIDPDIPVLLCWHVVLTANKIEQHSTRIC